MVPQVLCQLRDARNKLHDMLQDFIKQQGDNVHATGTLIEDARSQILVASTILQEDVPERTEQSADSDSDNISEY